MTITEVPQRSVPAMSTVVNIHRETEVPDHFVWSLFNSIYFNICCLGLVAFTYSVKVGGCLAASQESVCGPQRSPCSQGP